MPRLLLVLVSRSHCTPVTWHISSISSHLHLGIDPQTSDGTNFPPWQNTHQGRMYFIPVRFGATTDNTVAIHNTVTWLTQHIGNAQELGGIWPPSLHTPTHPYLPLRGSRQKPEGEMTWWQTCYNVAPVKTVPTLKRGVVLCWVGAIFLMYSLCWRLVIIPPL